MIALKLIKCRQADDYIERRLFFFLLCFTFWSVSYQKFEIHTADFGVVRIYNVKFLQIKC